MSSLMPAIEYASTAVGYRSPARYVARARFLFDAVDLHGKRVLEVGCGTGAWVVWAALHGASHVLGLEPEADGASSGSLIACKRLVDALSLGDRVQVSAVHIEDLTDVQPFDVVVMYGVINHLDEKAVVAIHRDHRAAAKFVTILRHLKTLLVPGALVIATEAGRKNLWNQLGLRSPFAPGQEWDKHQEPEVWISIFGQAGFQFLDLRWQPLYPFGRLSAHRLAQFATASHFVLRFQAPDRVEEVEQAAR